VQLFYGLGMQEQRWKHQARSETDFDLHEIFKPLARWKDQMVIVENVHNAGGGGLHSNKNIFIGRSGDFPTGQSFDRYLARAIGKTDPISSTNLMHHCGQGSIAHVSGDGPGQPYPAEWNPIRAHGAIFGGNKGGTTTDIEQLLARDKSVLDALAGEISRMNARLAGPERAKLDQFTQSLRAMETQLAALARLRGSCDGGPVPNVQVMGTASLPSHNPGESPKGIADFQVTRRFFPELAQAMVDLTFNAQLCGLTRVSSIALAPRTGNSVPSMLFSFIGPTATDHEAHHDKSWDVLDKLDTHMTGQFARLAEKMAAVPEGDGTMLSNSLLVLGNAGGGHHCPTSVSPEPYVFVLLGRAGGAVKTGRLLALPKGAHFGNDLCVSIARALDAPIESFGDPVKCKGPIPGL
jgi:hypothetical protein